MTSDDDIDPADLDLWNAWEAEFTAARPQYAAGRLVRAGGGDPGDLTVVYTPAWLRAFGRWLVGEEHCSDDQARLLFELAEQAEAI